MNRRQFFKRSLVIGGSLVGVGAGAALLIEGANRLDLKIATALKRLELLSNKNLVQTGEWDIYKIFMHCAQSVEYSMSKFPQHKSNFFKNTIGTLAFSIFEYKGKMIHGLSEPIPGSALIKSSSDTNAALDHLKKSLIEFENYKGELAPHFAYGELTKSEYEIAHVMHLYNHLEEIQS
ncbi:MAG: DUF1569 domain-containing protein [Colwellia sp.]|uniref:DUF1569 domain-containing protein n=1 Tax=Colwellia sp. TaxID=56799 RepID=UPI0025BA13E0|nr:DUF1569 domain-containing protein [Colwellia sp.]NQZ28279.1 DUF1569 domain-containing protein [Colwellia sp.]